MISFDYRPEADGYLALARNDGRRDLTGMAQQRFRVPWVSFCFLLLMVALNVFTLVAIVPKFERIFQDVSPGQPLPHATAFIINYRFLLALVMAGWLIFCGILGWRRNHHSILFNKIGVLWSFLQLGTIVITLFMPLSTGIIVGLPEQDTKPVFPPLS